MVNPVYMQIVEDIKARINSGDLKPGDAVASEKTLCETYGASRMTVRKGLAVLVNEGYIYSVPGKGNFVSKPVLNEYTLYYDEMSNSINSVDKTKLLEVNIIIPDEKLSGELQITRNKNVIMLRRLYYTDGIPVAYDLKYLLYQKGMPIVEKEIERATFPEMLSGSVPQFALAKELNIFAAVPDDEVKRYLNIHQELAILVVQQKLFNHQRKPVAFGTTYYRGDYIKLQALSR